MNAACAGSTLPLMLFLLIGLSFGACDAKTQSGHSTANAPLRQSSSTGNNPTLFFDLPLGTNYQAMVERMGQPQMDYGSGVEMPEYSLSPSGLAIVLFGTDHTVKQVLVHWGSEADGATAAAWPEEGLGADLSSLEAEHSETVLSRERVDPRLLLGVKRGMSISDLSRQIGLRVDTEDETPSAIECLLEPHGIAKIGVGADHVISDVSLLWWRGK